MGETEIEMDDKGLRRGIGILGDLEWRGGGRASEGVSQDSQLFVLETVPNFFRDPSKVPQTDLAGVVVIE